MAQSCVENAIRELEQETKKIRQAIAALREFRPQAGAAGGRTRRGRRLSAAARQRISLAAKKRWAALRASKQKS